MFVNDITGRLEKGSQEPQVFDVFEKFLAFGGFENHGVVLEAGIV